jgi:hypothetical protein
MRSPTASPALSSGYSADYRKQQSGGREALPAPAASAAAAPPPPRRPRHRPFDESKVTAFKTIAEREPNNQKPRVELANLYFDSKIRRRDQVVATH